MRTMHAYVPTNCINAERKLTPQSLTASETRRQFEAVLSRLNLENAMRIMALQKTVIRAMATTRVVQRTFHVVAVSKFTSEMVTSDWSPTPLPPPTPSPPPPPPLLLLLVSPRLVPPVSGEDIVAPSSTMRSRRAQWTCIYTPLKYCVSEGGKCRFCRERTVCAAGARTALRSRPRWGSLREAATCRPGVCAPTIRCRGPRCHRSHHSPWDSFENYGDTTASILSPWNYESTSKN